MGGPESNRRCRNGRVREVSACRVRSRADRTLADMEANQSACGVSRRTVRACCFGYGTAGWHGLSAAPSVPGASRPPYDRADGGHIISERSRHAWLCSGGSCLAIQPSSWDSSPVTCSDPCLRPHIRWRTLSNRRVGWRCVGDRNESGNHRAQRVIPPSGLASRAFRIAGAVATCRPLYRDGCGTEQDPESMKDHFTKLYEHLAWADARVLESLRAAHSRDQSLSGPGSSAGRGFCRSCIPRLL